MIFDNYLMVDWSSSTANNNVGENSIWLAWIESGKQIKFFNPGNRAIALQEITTLLRSAQGRTIIGFDFPFGYPADSYNPLGCNNWHGLWEFINNSIMNRETERDRFEVAGDINELFEGEGPFWGQHQTHDYPNLGHHAPNQNYGENLPSEFRHIETALLNQPGINPNPVWKLFGNGTVGSQTLLGIPVVNTLRENTLREEFNFTVWPFEDLDDDKHVIVEIFPSIWKSDEEDKRNLGLVKDAGQVKTVVEQIFCHDRDGTLQNLLDAPCIYERNKIAEETENQKIKKDDIMKKEGWILGVDEEGKVADMITCNRPHLLYV